MKKLFTLILLLSFSAVHAENELNMPVFSGIDKNDYRCLARNIYFEARNQSTLGQIAVGLVTINRVKHTRWPNSICGVVWQKNQFSWTHDNKSDVPRNLDAWKRAQGLALMLLKNEVRDFTGGAVYYHADYVNPVWNKQLVKTTTIDNHIFYR